MTDWIELQKTYEFSVYAKRDLVLVRGKGARVWDADGNEYIDCVAGLGVVALGHCHPVLVNALTGQAQRLGNCSNLFFNDQGAALFQRLAEISPNGLNRTYFCNSGAESVEAAIKFARHTTGRTDFICAEGGFHGRTMGAVSATHNPDYRKDFEPLVPGFHFTPFNDFDKLAGLVTTQTAGILLEVVQGDGGVNIGQESFFHQVQDLCREKGILLIIDEVQTGLCRTGKLFACEHYGLEPDILCLAKSMAGGIPMGAVMCSDRIQPLVRKHGSTFGGNPLNLPGVREIRHLGLMIGIELTEPAADTILKLQQKGVLVMSAGEKVMRLLPPLTIPQEDLEMVAARLADVLAG